MKRAAGAILPPLSGADTDASSKRSQLYPRVRRAILDGSLASGTRLPSTRTVARDLRVSRTTAEEAFAQLVLEGNVERRVGDGTYVSSAVRAPRSAPRGSTSRPGGRPSRPCPRTSTPFRFARSAQASPTPAPSPSPPGSGFSRAA